MSVSMVAQAFSPRFVWLPILVINFLWVVLINANPQALLVKAEEGLIDTCQGNRICLFHFPAQACHINELFIESLGLCRHAFNLSTCNLVLSRA